MPGALVVYLINNPFVMGHTEVMNLFQKIFTESDDKTIYLCNCKKSSNPPYCDGTHNKI